MPRLLATILTALAAAACSAPPVVATDIDAVEGAARVWHDALTLRDPSAAARALRDEARRATGSDDGYAWIRHLAADTATGDWRRTAAVAELAWFCGEFQQGTRRRQLFLTAARLGWRAWIAGRAAASDDSLVAHTRRVQALATARWLAVQEAVPRAPATYDDVAGPVEVRVTPSPDRYADPEFYDRIRPAWTIRADGFELAAQVDGVGAPLVGIRTNDGSLRAYEPPYPPEGRIHALTAVLRELADGSLELSYHDPLRAPRLHDLDAPLAADFSAAYGLLLSRTELHWLSDRGFFEPDATESRRGIYLLQPYDPDRTVVLMVHGLWSGPQTWFRMTNSIWADPTLRERVQVWHALYPTGVPILNNARELRRQLTATLADLDPEGDDRAGRDVVLLGHSMGGVLSKLLVSASGDRIWNARFDVGLDELDLDPPDRDLVARTYRFDPMPQVTRAVLIAAPLGGSPMARSFTAWVGRWFVDAGARATGYLARLVARNPDALRPGAPDTPTSLDVLDPAHPVIAEIKDLPVAPGVPVHTVIGRVEGPDVPDAASSDGVVPFASAHYPAATTETVVPGDHSLPRYRAAIDVVLSTLREHVGSAPSDTAIGATQR